MRQTRVQVSVNRSTRKATISGDRLFVGDSSITVSVDGFVSDEVTELAPYIQLLFQGRVCAEAELTEESAGDSSTLAGSLSTNTVPLFDLFKGQPSNAVMEVEVAIFASLEAEPIAAGRVKVYNFPRQGGVAPANMPTASEVWENINKFISDETERATDAESTLAQSIANETSRAKGVEQALANTISEEVERATKAEANRVRTVNGVGYDENGNVDVAKLKGDTLELETRLWKDGTHPTLTIGNDTIKHEAAIPDADGNYLAVNVNGNTADKSGCVTLTANSVPVSKNDATTVSDAISNETSRAKSAENTLNDAIKSLKTDVYTKTEVDAKLTSVYKFKGTVATYGDLPENASNGDVYNVEDTGDNYAYVTEEGAWDKLAGDIDLSDYATKDEAANPLADWSGDTPATLNEIVSILKSMATDLGGKFVG